jgi:hypothetical protein
MDHQIPAPPTFDGVRFESLQAAIEHGPKLFVELMAAINSRDGREVVRWLEDVATTRPIVRDSEGRYLFA